MKFIQKQGSIIQFLIYLCLIFIGGMFFSILLSLIIPVPDDVADWQFSVGYVFAIVLTIALALTVERNKIFEKKEQAEALHTDIKSASIRTENIVFELEGLVERQLEQEKEIYLSVGKNSHSEIIEQKGKNRRTYRTLTDIRSNLSEYPVLRTNTDILRLFEEIVNCHTQLMTQKTFYNKAAAEYNASIQKFPGVLFRKKEHLEKLEYYKEADETIVPKEDSFKEKINLSKE